MNKKILLFLIILLPLYNTTIANFIQAKSVEEFQELKEDEKEWFLSNVIVYEDLSFSKKVTLDEEEISLKPNDTEGFEYYEVYADRKEVGVIKASDFESDVIEEKSKIISERSDLNNENSISYAKTRKESFISKENKVSRLGHLKSESYIYKDLSKAPRKSTSADRNKVYYIKKSVETNTGLYYLLSERPSSTTGVVGWVKATELTTHNHVGVDRNKKTFILKGTHRVTYKAWGGKQDISHSNNSQLKGKRFDVNLTEKVGNNIWYRGTISGERDNVWIHSRGVTNVPKENKVSRLGHLKSESYIYKDLSKAPRKSTSADRNKVYYIKKSVETNTGLYYLLSERPSSTTGVVGWVKATELTTYNHVGVDRNKTILTLNGTGQAWSKAWGGKQDLVFNSLNKYTNIRFHVNLTEKVGNNIWYRGNIDKSKVNVWIRSNQVIDINHEVSYTKYNLSLKNAVSIQLNKSKPLLQSNHAYVESNQLNGRTLLSNAKVYQRDFPINSSAEAKNNLLYINTGNKRVNIIEENSQWSIIGTENQYYVKPLEDQLYNIMNPSGKESSENHVFQFMNLSQSVNYSSIELNRSLPRSGVLKNTGAAFVKASKQNKVNEMYLIAHAKLETGNGTSLLASGKLEVGVDQKGTPRLVTNKNRKSLKAIRNVYNMFGIGAFDNNANEAGAIRAYQEGWFSVNEAIVGGAKWIGNGYIYNEFNQNTLYKMRWNPQMNNGYFWKQYATDARWAEKQALILQGIYKDIGVEKKLKLDMPTYN